MKQMKKDGASGEACNKMSRNLRSRSQKKTSRSRRAREGGLSIKEISADATFVLADSSNFRLLVQKLTGASTEQVQREREEQQQRTRAFVQSKLLNSSPKSPLDESFLGIQSPSRSTSSASSSNCSGVNSERSGIENFRDWRSQREDCRDPSYPRLLPLFPVQASSF